MEQNRVQRKIRILINIILFQMLLVLMIICLQRIAIFDSVTKKFFSANAIINTLLFITFLLSLSGIWLARAISDLAKLENLAFSQRIKIEENEKFINVLRSHKHDFINHLQVIRGLSGLKKYAELENFIADLAKEIQEEGTLALVNHPTLNALLLTKKRAAEDCSINFEVTSEANLSLLKITAIDLTRIIGNLLDNAIQAVCAVESAEKRNVLVNINENADYYFFTIKNDWPIIPKNLQKKIFERGFSTKEEDGHGLGLANVMDILKKNNGKLDLISEPNSGTIFTVMLPKENLTGDPLNL